jgi:branched-chain amino acid transport system permease protein
MSWAQLDKTKFLTGPFYYYALTIAVVSVLAMHRAVNSPLGLALRAIRDNPLKARFLGINLQRGQFIAFVISAIYGGAGGAILGVSIGLADPELAYWTQSGNMIFMVILGGFGHFAGPLVGVTVFTILQDWLMASTQYWRFALGATLAILVIAAPTGLVGVLAQLRAKISGTRVRQQ